MNSVYIHIPFCEKKCRYCDFYSITNTKLMDNYVAHLLREIELFANEHKEKHILKTLFFGGGTPSILPPEHYEKIILQLQKYWDFSSNIEFTIEANPGTIDYNKLSQYRQLGINRLSIGVQSFNDKLLKFLDRIHSREQAIEAIENAQKAGYENISIDLIFSIENQKLSDIKEDIDIINNYHIKHLSAYSLIYEEDTPLYQDLINKKVKQTSQNTESKLYLSMISYLAKYNYIQYEVSNFAQKGFRCKHNLNYWHRGEYAGFGPAAHAFYNNYRYKNYSDISKYFQLIDEAKLPLESIESLDESQILYEKVLLALRADGLNLNAFPQAKDNTKLNKELEVMLKQDLILPYENTIQLSAKGYSLCNSITLRIIEMLENNTESER